MSNEAAEMTTNQRMIRVIYPQIDWDQYDREVRRATVERIRLEIRLSSFAANNPDRGGPYSMYREILAILDADAAR